MLKKEKATQQNVVQPAKKIAKTKVNTANSNLANTTQNVNNNTVNKLNDVVITENFGNWFSKQNEWICKVGLKFKNDSIYTHNRQAAVINNIASRVFITHNKYLFLDSISNDLKIIKNKNELIDVLNRRYLLKNNVDENFLKELLIQNYVETIQYEIDPFATKVQLYKKDTVLHIILNTIKINTFKLNINITKKEYDEIIAAYKKHFEHLDEIMQFLVACRFTENRRKSFLYVNAPAEWGKSFFKNILFEIGLAHEINYVDLTKQPSGLSPHDFLNTFVLVVDEFKYFPHEMKDLTNYFRVESKNQLRSVVPVYAKLFLSKEFSESFTNGVDEQILDRVSVIKIKNTKKLSNIELFKKDRYKFYLVVKHYIYNYINKLIKYYINLGKHEAYNKATDFLEQFNNKYKIKALNLDTLIKQKFYYIIYNVAEYLKLKETNYEYNATYATLSKIILKYENILDDFILYKNKLIIKRLTKVFEYILKTEFDESEFKKARYRKTEIFDILNCAESKTNKVNGVSVFGVPFEINIIKNTLISLGIDVDSVNNVNVENNTTKHVDTLNNFEDFEDYDFYNTNNDLEETITKNGW
jgi:hypothetical protein